MKSIFPVLVFATAAWGQVGRTLDWPTYGADAQRTGWEKSDGRISKDEVAKNFQLLWKMQQKGSERLMAPLIVGNLIGYRGFKELAFVGGSDDSFYVMDSDLNRMYWQTKFVSPEAPKPSAACPGGMTGMPTLLTLSLRRPRPATPGAAPAAPRPNPMYGPRAAYLISSDGQLRRINVANGNEAGMPFQVMPANARVSTLNVSDNVLYATTSHGCGGVPNSVWAIDIGNPDPSAAPAVTALETGGGNFLGLGGPVIGNDGVIYVQTGDGVSDPEKGRFSNALVALTPRSLKPAGYFLDTASGSPVKGELNSVTPVIFEYKDRDLIVTASRDGRLYLLDSTSIAQDHKTPLAASAKVAPSAGGLWGGLTTWADANGTRFVMASIWGDSNGRGSSVTSFKVEESGGKFAFTPVWTAKDLVKPVPPVVANGVAFVLSSGEGRTNAVLYALDAVTGAPIWSTKGQVTAPGNLTPLTVANGRVYFVTADSSVWVFGLPLEL